MRLIIHDVPAEKAPQLMELVQKLYLKLDKAIEIDSREFIIDVPEPIDKMEEKVAKDVLGQLIMFCSSSGLYVTLPPTPKPH